MFGRLGVFGNYGSTGGWLNDSSGIVFFSKSTNFPEDGNAFVTDLFLKKLP